jgi:hypothetical protein
MPFSTQALTDLAKGDLTYHAGNVRMMLLRGAGTPLRSNNTIANVLAEASLDECNATGYARKSVTNPVIDTSGTLTRVKGDAVDFEEIGNGTNNDITHAVIYIGTLDSADDATNRLVMWYPVSPAVTTNGTQVLVNPDTGDVYGQIESNPT